jgi:hypothetical protein
MSGHKLSTLRIQKAASARLARRRMRKALRKEQTQNRSEYLHEQHVADMEKVFRDIEHRQSLFSGSLDQFQSRTLQRMEQESNAVIMASHASLFEDMQGLLNQMWLDTDETVTNGLIQTLNTLEDQRQDMEGLKDLQTDLLYKQAANREENERLSVQFKENQQLVANVFLDFQSRQSEIADNQQQLFQRVQDFIQQQEELGRFQDSKEEIVHKQLADAQSLYDFVINTFHHEKFSPGEAQRSVYEMGKAYQNLEQGFLDAAMINAQRAYQSLSEQRLTLQQKQAEWELLYLDVENRLRQLLIDAEGLKEIPSVDLDGNEIGQMIDVDYWSSRRLSRLKTMIHTRLEQMKTHAEELQTVDLLAIQQTELPRIFEELENTCSMAMEEALNSQLRVNIADIVIQALENQGFCFSDSEYQQKDKRKTFSANVINLAGDEIIIGVEPNKGEPGTSNLHLISADAGQRTEHELKQRANEIFTTLNQFGLENGNIQVLPDKRQEIRQQQEYAEARERQQSHLTQ